MIPASPLRVADGSLKPIQKVKVGDRILSRDYATGKTAGQKVEQVKVRHVKATLVVTLSTGEKIETTKEHPVYVAGENFVPVDRLVSSNCIMRPCRQNLTEGALFKECAFLLGDGR